MADKRIDELEAAASVTTNDLFVLEQAGTAKKLDAQTLENWLLALAQGHGGITGIAKTGTAGTNPVVDTYTITFSDTSTTTFDVTNGVKGDTGDQTYVYIKYSNREPIADSDLTDTPSAWMGICSTTASTAPATYGSYSWYEIKGAKGDPGNDVTISSTSVKYQAWTSGTQYPTGTWLDNPPAVTPGNYLWTRTIVNYSDGGQTVSYSVSRWGMDGSGAVASVNNQLPDSGGNVTLTASDVGALPDSYQPPVTSVNNKTGTVVLNNTDVNAPLGLSMSASLSSAGWYRVLQTNDLAGQSFDFAICRRGTSADNEVHSISLGVLYGGKYPWMNENSGSGTNQLIDKIRYTSDSSYAYADIHYTGSSANTVYVDIRPHGAADNNQSIAKGLSAVADAPSGETVLTTHEFQNNNALNNEATIVPTLYNLTGSITINGGHIAYNSDKSILQFTANAIINITARSGSGGGFKFNLPFAYNGPTTSFYVGTQSKFVDEVVYVQVANGSSEVTVRTTETNHNITTGTVRFLIAPVTLYMN